MSKILSVVRKEYLERVRSRSFVIGTILGPLLMAALAVGPALLANTGGDEARKVGVVDLSSTVLASLQRELASRGAEHVTLIPIPCQGRPVVGCESDLKDLILDGTFFSGLLVPADFVSSRQVTYYSTSVSASVFREDTLEPALNQVLREARFAEVNVPATLHEYVLATTDWTSVSIKAGGESEQNEVVSLVMAFVLIFIIYVMVLMYGNQALMAVIEEKGSRMAEILLSSLKPEQLMLGKVIGIGLAGVTQFGVWTLAFALLASQNLAIGDFTLDASFLSPIILTSFFFFFLFGFLLYATIYAGIGAMCNSVQDAQQFSSVIMMGIIIPMVMISFVMRSPDSTVSVVLSLVPLFAPVLMFMRVCVQTPPMWQLVLSWVLLLGAILLAARISGKLFRVGILLYGAAPTWGTLIRAIRS